MSIFELKKSVPERFMYGTVVEWVTMRSRSTFAQRLFTSALISGNFFRASIS
jgi:hypothetical protein